MLGGFDSAITKTRRSDSSVSAIRNAAHLIGTSSGPLLGEQRAKEAQKKIEQTSDYKPVIKELQGYILDNARSFKISEYSEKIVWRTKDDKRTGYVTPLGKAVLDIIQAKRKKDDTHQDREIVIKIYEKLTSSSTDEAKALKVIIEQVPSLRVATANQRKASLS